MTNVLSFERAVRALRGPDIEAERKARIRERWIDARRRAWNGTVSSADVGMFGAEQLLQEIGPHYVDRRLAVFDQHGVISFIEPPEALNVLAESGAGTGFTQTC